MRALVTGATGFIGSAIAARLAAGGWHVRALSRPGGDRANLEGLDVEPVTGDLAQAENLAPALRDCDALFHVAADYRLWVPDPSAMYRTNVDGTRVLLGLALRAGVRRIVYTSSVATLAARADGEPADENAAAGLEEMHGHYKRSKWLAEREVLRLVEERGLPAVVVHPTAPVGPRDRKPTPTGRMILDAAAGRMPAYVDTGLNIVHVDDVAAGHLLAWEHGRVGRRYILGGTDMSLREIFERVAACAGVPPPRWKLPHTAVMPFAWFAEAWARVSGREPRVTVDGVRLARKKMYFTSRRAAEELDYHARPGAEAIADAVAWYREHGYLG